MKSIPLTQGKVTLVDDEDYEYLNQWKWHTEKSDGGNTYYAVRNIQLGFKKRTTTKMHRVIMNTPTDMQVDHIDMNGLNNQRSNLRNVTQSQNQRNREVQRNNQTGYKGVGRTKNKRRFRARIKIGRQSIVLGYFLDAKEAALAYDEAAKKYHGEFARLNFPQERKAQ